MGSKKISYLKRDVLHNNFNMIRLCPVPSQFSSLYKVLETKQSLRCLKSLSYFLYGTDNSNPDQFTSFLIKGVIGEDVNCLSKVSDDLNLVLGFSFTITTHSEDLSDLTLQVLTSKTAGVILEYALRKTNISDYSLYPVNTNCIGYKGCLSLNHICNLLAVLLGYGANAGRAIKLFSHDDLDGVAPEIIFRKYYDFESSNAVIDVTHLSQSNCGAVIRDFYESGEFLKYDFVFITDLNLKPDVFRVSVHEPLQRVLNSKVTAFDFLKYRGTVFIDHHMDSRNIFGGLQHYMQSYMCSGLKQVTYFEFINYSDEECATLQLLSYLRGVYSDSGLLPCSSLWQRYAHNYLVPGSDIARSFCEIFAGHVNAWDTFSWEKFPIDKVARDLNILFQFVGISKFVTSMMNRRGCAMQFSGSERVVITAKLQELQDAYSNIVTSSLKIVPHYRETGYAHPMYKCLVFEYSGNISLLCSMLRMNFKGKADYIICLNSERKAVEFRTITSNVDIRELAVFYGGGGHPNASGCPYDLSNEKFVQNIIEPYRSLPLYSKIKEN